MKPQRRNALVLAAALIAALLTGFYALSRDKELAGDLLKALFGLSGGTTAGGGPISLREGDNDHRRVSARSNSPRIRLAPGAPAG